MRIAFLCSDQDHPVNRYLNNWIGQHSSEHQAELVRRKSQLKEGDFLFLISCSEIVNSADRESFAHTLVLHASDLPKGRGWSPHIWEIIGGAEYLTVCLLEAADKVDAGKIWCKKIVPVPKHALWNEINNLLFSAQMELIDYAISHWPDIVPESQDSSITPTYYRRRIPEDSTLDIEKPLSSQFDLLRVCDPNRFPALVEINGYRYKLFLEKADE